MLFELLPIPVSFLLFIDEVFLVHGPILLSVLLLIQGEFFWQSFTGAVEEAESFICSRDFAKVRQVVSLVNGSSVTSSILQSLSDISHIWVALFRQAKVCKLAVSVGGPWSQT